MRKPKKAILKLELSVEYKLNGESKEHLTKRLMGVVDYAAGAGLLTGDGPAEVLSMGYGVTETKEDL